MDFKDRLKQLRNDKNLPTTQLAAFLQKSEGAIRMWESGRSFPDANTLIKLAEYFGCTTDYLLGLSVWQNSTVEQENLNMINEFDELISTLSVEQRIGLLINLCRIVDCFRVMSEENSVYQKSAFDLCMTIFEGMGRILRATEYSIRVPNFINEPSVQYNNVVRQVEHSIEKIAMNNSKSISSLLQLTNLADTLLKEAYEFLTNKKYTDKFENEADKQPEAGDTQ